MIAEKLKSAVRHHQAGDLSRAEGLYREILTQQPNHPDALHLLGVLARQTGRAELAIQSIAKAAEINRSSPAFFFNLANALRDRGRLDQAGEHYRRALALDPELVEAHLNLGDVLQRQGRLSEALAAYDAGLALRPFDFQARLVRGMLWLQTGNLREGWREFEWRWRLDRGTQLKALPQPFWDGEDLSGQTLLVHPEPSLGDQLLFASCYPELMAQAKRCLFLCDPRLSALFTRSFPGATIHSTGSLGANRWPAQLNEVNYRVAAGSVPRFLRRDWESFPRHPGYLLADPERRHRYWSRLAALGDGLKVGVCWRGPVAGDKRRAGRGTQLADWLPVLSVPNVRFVNLQAGDCRAELQALEGPAADDLRRHIDGSWRHDPDEQAALLSALDLVIGVPNCTIHLAGALGVPVWNVVAHWASWRWFVERDDSPWYPSMQLFRQSNPARWNDVFAHVAARLAQLAAIPQPPALPVESNV